MALQDIVHQTVTGLGYDLVEVDRTGGGLLRITIDLPWVVENQGENQGTGNVAGQFVTVEDCEKVTRQLQFALEVDGVEYKRLEVSSPGIDRPLRNEADLARFVGHEVDVTLKVPIGLAAVAQNNGDSGAQAGPKVAATRKKFRGTLEKVEAGGWQIVWSDAPPVKPGVRVSKKRAPAPVLSLGFELNELKEARLAPIVSFNGLDLKGRGEPDADTEPGTARVDTVAND